MIKGKQNRIRLDELSPVYDDTGDLDETAIALEHVKYVLMIKDGNNVNIVY